MSILYKDDSDLYRLRPEITLHLYTSSSPCGNASVKKWAKGGIRTTLNGNDDDDDSIGMNWSFAKPHPKLLIKARADGEVALLVKRDGTLSDVNTMKQKITNGQQSFPPPGTAMV